ncbi:MAG: polysaccharide export protein [Candidatus Omnitrophica bacterium]|nr:polysaccharide export protein [Candidatus Omnitrophota bacterium]
MIKALRFFIIPAVLLCAVIAVSAQQGDGDKGKEYYISEGDLLDINVYDEPDLTKTVRVSHEGTISYPLIGTVSVSGLTAEKLEVKIRDLLEKDYLVNPQVIVLIREYSKVYVMGQVRRPGAYELKAGMTAVEAIALAGGLTDIASPNGTKVIRKKDGKERVFNVPVSSILKGGDASKDVVLERNDTIAVPESLF